VTQSDGTPTKTVRMKIRHYRQVYANRPDPIVFLPITVSTSGHVYEDFTRRTLTSSVYMCQVTILINYQLQTLGYQKLVDQKLVLSTVGLKFWKITDTLFRISSISNPFKKQPLWFVVPLCFSTGPSKLLKFLVTSHLGWTERKP
jgi:hypothetical protein